MENRLNARGGNTQARENRNQAQLRANEEARRKIENERDAMKAREEFVKQQTRMEIAARQAQAEAERFNFGRNDTDRLNNREAGLRELMNQKLKEAQAFQAGDDPVAQENRIVQALQHRLDLLDVMMEKERQRYQLQRDEYQLLQDKRREMEKTLISAGPEQMMRQLAAFEANRKGVSAGQFWAMSPEMRQAIMDQNPNMSPEMREIRRQRNQLGQPKGADGLQKDGEHLAALHNRLLELLGPLVKEGEKPPEGLAAERAALEIDRLGKSAGAAALEVDRLSGAVKGLIERIEGGEGAPRRQSGLIGTLPQTRGHAPGLAGGIRG